MPIVGVSNVGFVEGGEGDGWKCIGHSLAVGVDGEVIAQGSFGENAEDVLYIEV